MGTFDINKVKKYLDENYNTAVETGTFLGESAEILSNHFTNLYTIEIDKDIFNVIQAKFKNNKKIKVYFGNSVRVLDSILPLIKNEKVVYYLDAHFSGNNKTNWNESLWKGYGVNTGYINQYLSNTPTSKEQVPLQQEIMKIHKHHKNECILYIDDFDKIDPRTLLGTKDLKFKGEDWSCVNFNIIFNNISDRMILKEIINNEILIIKLKSVL